jgi:hypothetical protein
MDINNLPEKYPKYQPPETEIDYSQSALPKVYREKRNKKELRQRRPAKEKQLDMSQLPFGKINRSQREDLEIRKVAKEDICICWIPGCHKRAQQAYHHVIQKSIILIDHKLNFLRACDKHHPECDEGKISQVDQFEIVAHKNNTTVEEILKTLEQFSGVKLFIDGDRVRVNKPVLKKVNRV